jgi:uncharacterized protein (TIGR03435 family)
MLVRFTVLICVIAATVQVSGAAQLSFGSPEASRPSAEGLGTGPSGPSMFTAIQEQLGLRLEATKGPVGVIVIDALDRPSDN